MKKTFTILMAFAALLFFSCSADVPEPEPEQKPEVVERTYKIDIDLGNGDIKTYEVVGGKDFTVPSFGERSDGSYCAMLKTSGGRRFDSGDTLKITSDLALTAVWSDWKYGFDPVTGLVVEAKGKSPIAVIPKEIDGVAVKGLGRNLFINRTEIEELYLPDGIETLSYGSLSGTTGIKEIFVPSSVTVAESYVFYEWTAEQKIVLETFEQTKEWDPAWLRGSIAKLEAGNAITDGIGFYLPCTLGDGREGLEYVAPVAAGNKNQTIPGSVDGKPVLKLSSDAFRGNAIIESVTIEEGFEQIENLAFYECKSLGSVKLPSSLRSIGSNAFGFILGADMTLPAGLEYVGMDAFRNWTDRTKCITVSRYSDILDWHVLWLESGPAVDYEGITRSGDWEYAERKDAEGSVTNLILHRYVGSASEITLPTEFGGVAVSEIGPGLFKQDRTIAKVTVPGTYRELGKLMFCDAFVAEVILEEGIEAIGEQCFNGASNINAIILPSTVEKIGNDAFCYSSLATVTLNEGLTEIGERAFMRMGNLVSLELPSSLLTIGNEAFSESANLSSLILPEGLERIGERAFCHTQSLKEISIPSSVVWCGENAFEQWYEDSTITVPSEEQTYTWDPAWLAENRANIVFGSRNCSGIWAYRVLADEDGGSFVEIRGADTTEKAIVIPSELEGLPVRSIGENAFAGTAIESVTIPGSVKTIGYGAFKSTSKLNEVKFNEGLEVIGDSAFALSAIKSAVLPSTVKSLGVEAFNGAGLTELILNEGLESTGSSCFSSLKNLKEVTLPSTLLDIGDHAFYFAKGIEKIVLPEKLSHIPDHSFDNCLNLSELVIPEGVRTIGKQAFAGCEKLMTVVIPEHTRLSGEKVFNGWSNKQTISIQDSECTRNWHRDWATYSNAVKVYRNEQKTEDGIVWKKYTLPDGTEGAFLLSIPERTEAYEFTVPSEIGGLPVTGIGMNSFNGDKMLTKIVLPDTVRVIEYAAFWKATNLKEVVFGKSLETIGNYAFGYAGLTGAVTLPDSVRTVGHSAFVHNEAMTGIDLGSGVRSIGNNAFEYCSNLASVTIGSECGYIGEFAFGSCSALSSIGLPASVKKIHNNTFEKCSSLVSIDLSNIEEIGSYAFNTSPALVSVDLSSLVKLGKGAFVDCSKLESVAFGPSLETLGEEAFKKCKALANVTMAGSIEKIPSQCFQDCSSLTSFPWKSGLKRIETSAFAGAGLKGDLILPAGLELVGDSAFSGVPFSSVAVPESVTYVGQDAFRRNDAATQKIILVTDANLASWDPYWTNEKENNVEIKNSQV